MKMNRALYSWGRWVGTHSASIAAVCALVSVLAVFAAARIGIDTDIASMLPQDNKIAREYTRIGDAFESTASLIVVVEGPDRDSLILGARALESAIRDSASVAPLVRSIDWKSDRDFAASRGLVLQKPEDLADTERVLSSRGLLEGLRAANDAFEDELGDGSDEEVSGPGGERDSAALMSRFALFARSLGEAFDVPPGGDLSSPAAAMADAWVFGEEYMIDPEEKTLLMNVRPSFNIGDRRRLTALSEGMRELCGRVSATVGTVSFGLTGDAESEAAEERAIGADVLYPSLAAMAAIGILFFFSFRRFRSIALALVTLAAGILWDVAIAALTVGKLNMITSSFGALLVGLGIDFGIHAASRYDGELRQGGSPAEALGRTYAAVGFPVAVGGITTAAAFYMLLLSKTPAFREFALIAGTGILTTLGAAFLLLPALLALFSRASEERAGRRPRLEFGAVGACSLWAARHRVAVLSLAALSLAAAVTRVGLNSFEFDMRKIGPQGTDAQIFESLVESRFGISTWQHVAMSESAEGSAALAKAFEKAPLVEYTESIGDYLPSPEEQDRRLEIIAGMRSRLGPSGGTAPSSDSGKGEIVPSLIEELLRLEWNVTELGDLAAASLGENSLPVRKRSAILRELYGSEAGASGEEVFARVREKIAAADRDEAERRLSAVSEAFAGAVESRYRRLVSVSERVTEESLPESVRSDFIAPDGGGYLVRIVPKAGLSGEEAFTAFAAALQAAGPGATGTLVLGLELSREVLKEASRVALFVALAVFALVGIGFGSLRQTLVSAASFLVSVLWTFALTPSFGKFNIVSALALPLIVGIGVDYGVHVVNAFARSGGERDEVSHTARGLTLSMLTTLIGFGSLALIGTFRGISSLGITLSIGIAASFVAAVFLVPALLGPDLNASKRSES